MIVLPGMIDLHYHTAVGKGLCDHLPLWESLEEFWYPSIRALDAESAYWAAAASYLESVKAGVTTVNDMYRRLPDLGRAAVDIGIRAVLSNDVALPEHNLDTLADNKDAYDAVHGAGRRPGPGLRRDRVAAAGLTGTAARRPGAGRRAGHRHPRAPQRVADRGRGLEEAVRPPARPRSPTTPGLLGPDCIAAHCVWLSDTEIALMRETGTHISHNPSSNAKLGNGIARVPEMLAAGLNVGLGHDAAESSNTCDLFQVMKFASLVHRAARTDASLQQAPDVLAMATRNGAAALGHETGQLAAGGRPT